MLYPTPKAFVGSRIAGGRTSTITIIDDTLTPPENPTLKFSWPESAASDQTTERENVRHRRQRWNVIWLSPGTLTVIAVFTAALAIGLIVLWQSAKNRDGITLLNSDHYLWTYGPTAILVVIVSAWRQVDNASKIVTPWVSLQRGYTPADQGVLLDYISPLQFVSLGQALRHRHLPVIATIVGFVLLKVTTLASTGLLILEPNTSVQPGVGLILTSQFDGTLYNQTNFVANSDSSLIYKAFGISVYNLSLPDGLGNGTAYETFAMPSNTTQRNTLMSAQIDVLVPNFNCEPAQVSIDISSGDGTSNMTVSQPASCVRAGLAEPSFIFDSTTFASTVVPSIQRRGTMLRVNCFNETDVNRQLIVLAEMAYEQNFGHSSNTTRPAVGQAANITGGNVVINQVQSLLCRPSYSMVSSNATYDVSQDPPVVSLDLQKGQQGSRKLENFGDSDLGLVFNAAMIDAGTTFGDATTNQFSEDVPNAMLKMMAGADPTGYTILLDEGVMASRAQMVFGSVAAQIATKTLRRLHNETITGQAVFTQNRLQVSGLSLWLMFAGCILLVIIAGILWFVLPQNAGRFQPESLEKTASVLFNSNRLSAVLQDASGEEIGELKRQLQLFNYSVTSANGKSAGVADFSICVKDMGRVPRQGHDDDASQPHRHGNRWWRPLMLRRGLVILTICLPGLAIAALEAIHQVAIRHENGISLFRSQSDLPRANLCTRLIPALAMLLIATMFNAVDFNIAVLATYSTMRKRALSLKNAGLSLVGELPVTVLWKAIQLRLWPVLLSASAALLGAFLTIIVSGLYTIEQMPEIQHMQLAQTEIFNTTRVHATIDNGTAAVLTSLLEGTNLSYPAHTHLELMFPEMDSYKTSILSSFPENASFSVRIPALRASLDCSTLSQAQYNLTTDFNAQILSSTATLNAEVPLPQQCQLGSPVGQVSSVTIDQTFTLTQNQSYVGALLDIVLDLTDSTFGTGAGQGDLTQPPSPGCPSIAFIYGYADVNDASLTSSTALICTQHIDTLDTITFFTPKQTILNTSFSESSAHRLSSSPNNNPNITAFPFSLQHPLDQSLSLFNQSFFTSTTTLSSPVDPFFQGVLFGKTPLYPSNYKLLASTNPQDREIVFNAIQAFYRRYMTQALSGSGIRQTITSPNPSDAWNITVYDNAFVFRLRQYNVSKIILQVILGLMMMMLSAAYLLMDTREVVKMNPCSIAGKMVLLAGSQIVEVVGREGEESVGERKVMLGWWNDGRGGRRWGLEFVDDGDEKEKEMEVTMIPARVEGGVQARAGWF